MARTRKKSKIKNTKTPLFPPAVNDFFHRRLKEMGGAALMMFSSAGLLALASYNSADPSFNTGAKDETLHNFMGVPGAYMADLMLQTIGFAAVAFVFMLFCWGYRVFLKRPMIRWWLRILLMLFATLALAAALAQVRLEWSLGPYMGGSAGALILGSVASLFQSIFPLSSYVIAAIVMGVAGVGAMIGAMGFSREEWRVGIYRFFHWIGIIRDIAALVLYHIVEIMGAMWHITSGMIHKKAEEDPPETKPAKRQKPRVRNKEDLKERIEPTVVVPAKETIKSGKRVSTERQPSLGGIFIDENYQLPPLDLLQKPDEKGQKNLSESALKKNAEILHSVLEDFGINGDIVKVNPGPVVTLYELEPAPGLKSSRVINLSDDIARSMSAVSVRVAVVPGRNVIGIELPNKSRETVFLRELLSSEDYESTKSKLGLVLGKNIAGKPIIADLARMPHLLVAGTTGSGKSVGINAMIMSLLYRLPPEKCRMILIDPKMLELSIYDDIPHLLTPVVTDPKKAIVSLKWAVREMEDRYRAMSKLGVRNIEGYNARINQARKKGEILTRRVQTGFDPDTGKPVFEDQPIDMTELPYIVIVVDEFADLMLVAGKEVEAAIQRLAQMARAAGIHMIMATQRPSVDVVTGTVKANFPSRISFQVTSKIDSRTILGDSGAENLLGQGDMLYMSGGGRVTRVHGPFVSDDEVEKVVRHLKDQGTPTYMDEIVDEESDFASGGIADLIGGSDNSGDDLYDKAVQIVLSEGKASTSFVQRHLSIGYNRAAKIIEQMEKEGIISAANHVGKREILVGNGVG